MQSLINLELLMQELPNFEQRIKPLLNMLKLDKHGLQCDHLALRVNDENNALDLLKAFQTIGDVISNKNINGRPIVIIKLHQAFDFLNQKVRCIELPFPGDKHYSEQGWEHIELVLPCNALTIADLKQALLAVAPDLLFVLDGESKISVKMSEPKGNAEKLANPTIAFKHNGICVKVHPYTIEQIVAHE